MHSLSPDFSKYPDGLMPAIVQDANTLQVLMQGFMNVEALARTQQTTKVTFFSRSKNALWVKGETSGNFLNLVSLHLDCDQDSLLIMAHPTGPVCHTGATSCYGDEPLATSPLAFIGHLDTIIAARKENPVEGSYTTSLFNAGLARIAQKVGEEAIETVIEAMQNQEDKFVGEAADLLYHYLVLLHAKGVSLGTVSHKLRERHK
jgi:phosphoribosyl-AMP cyclohydrolase / phosphoribosyl-ATP pyrophosphohydrolase